MTNSELGVIYISSIIKNKKLDSTNIDDLIKILNLAIYSNRRKFKTKDEFNKSLKYIKNINTTNKRNNKFKSLLNIEDFKDIDISKYLIWWSYEIFNQRKIYKYQKENLLNDELLENYLNWSKILIRKLEIVSGFKKSCNTIINLSLKFNREISEIIRYLIQTDQLSVLHMTGKISDHSIAAMISENYLEKNNIQLTNPFSKDLIIKIKLRSDYLISSLNLACKHLIFTPINFENYCDFSLYQKLVYNKDK